MFSALLRLVCVGRLAFRHGYQPYPMDGGNVGQCSTRFGNTLSSVRRPGIRLACVPILAGFLFAFWAHSFAFLVIVNVKCMCVAVAVIAFHSVIHTVNNSASIREVVSTACGCDPIPIVRHNLGLWILIAFAVQKKQILDLLYAPNILSADQPPSHMDAETLQNGHRLDRMLSLPLLCGHGLSIFHQQQRVRCA
jgi:hypothetical protein